MAFRRTRREWFPKSAPRRSAKRGIIASSTRGNIGETWWSRRFVEVLEAFSHSSRIQRGRSYARSGQVMELAIGPGLVTAKVQGSRSRPYDVHLAIEPLGEEAWARIEDALSEQAKYAALLLAGEMPREIEAVFEAAGLHLFPSSSKELKTACSCPDWENPCKHVAATYYILAEHFDRDPFGILAWRGRAREALVNALQDRRSAGDDVPETSVEAPDTLDFWKASSQALALSFRPDKGGEPHAALRRLGPFEGGGSSDAVALLQGAWPRIVEAAKGRAVED
jgi:uncharacterized Zn finger protein